MQARIKPCSWRMLELKILTIFSMFSNVNPDRRADQAEEDSVLLTVINGFLSAANICYLSFFPRSWKPGVVRCGNGACALSRVWFFETPWTVVCQVSLSMGFSRQEYWRVGCHFLLQGIFPTYPGIEQASPTLERRFLFHWAIWEAQGGMGMCLAKYIFIFPCN